MLKEAIIQFVTLLFKVAFTLWLAVFCSHLLWAHRHVADLHLCSFNALLQIFWLLLRKFSLQVFSMNSGLKLHVFKLLLISDQCSSHIITIARLVAGNRHSFSGNFHVWIYIFSRYTVQFTPCKSIVNKIQQI